MAASAKQKLDEVKTHKMPDNSVVYDRLIPVIFAVLGIVTLILIVFSVGVLTGLIHWF